MLSQIVSDLDFLTEARRKILKILTFVRIFSGCKLQVWSIATSNLVYMLGAVMTTVEVK